MSEKSKRLMMIYSRLKSGPITIEMLSGWAHKNDVQISSRTFYRDLHDLENSYIPSNEKLVVTVGEKNRKTWKIEYVNKEEALTDFDLNSCILFEHFLPLSVVSSRKDSVEKMRQLFYEKYSKSQFEHFVDVAKKQIYATHFFEGTFLKKHHKILDDCIWSIQHKRKMEILSLNGDYMSNFPEIIFPQTFLPIQIIYHRGVIHVSGFLKENNQMIFLGMDQIEEYKLTNDPFDNKGCLTEIEKEMLKRFGLNQNINSQVYDIELKFTEILGAFVSNQFWHPTQKFLQLENGDYIMTMTCGINIELVGWIFEWMSDVKVLKPEILKNAVIDKLKLIIKCYEEDYHVPKSNNFISKIMIDNK